MDDKRLLSLLAELPIGVYEVNATGILIYINEALCSILGYDNRYEIIGKEAMSFYAYHDEEQKILEELRKGKIIRNEIIELRKKDGKTIYVEMSINPVWDEDGKLLGREGTIRDISMEEHLRHWMDTPVGYYEVRSNQEKDEIIVCNRRFAEIHGYANEGQMIGMDIRTFFISEDQYQQFVRTIIEKDNQQEPLVGYSIKIRLPSNLEKTLEINSQLVKTRSGKVIGRRGVVLDKTTEADLREAVNILKADIGQVLHSYSSTLLLSSAAIKTALTALEPDPFSDHFPLTTNFIDSVLQHPLHTLITALERLERKILEKQIGQDQDKWREINDFVKHSIHQLYSLEDPISVKESRMHTLRLAARRVINFFKQEKIVGLAREPIKEIRNAASDLERLTCLAFLHQAAADIYATEHSTHGLRDYIITGLRPEEVKQPVVMSEIVKQAMNNLKLYAHSRGAVFRVIDRSNNVKVKVVERDILRAISNLLHNAIKYSWTRLIGEPCWVEIRLFVQEKMIYVEIENYGVAIPEDEIRDESIYKLGYRGRLSSERGRLGTGIGLTDAKKTANDYHGDVIITSNPADRYSQDPLDYTQPFKTTAIFHIPVFRE